MLAINLSRRSWGVLSSFEWYSHCAHSWHALLVLSHIEYMNTKRQVEIRADPNIRLGGNLICFPVSADHQLLAAVILVQTMFCDHSSLLLFQMSRFTPPPARIYPSRERRSLLY